MEDSVDSACFDLLTSREGDRLLRLGCYGLFQQHKSYFDFAKFHLG